MRYVSIDLETLGTNPSYCDIIEFGAVIDDGKTALDELQFFHRYILPPRRYGRARFYQGEPYAMAMHAEKLYRIDAREEPYLYTDPEDLAKEFWAFLVNNDFKEEEDGSVKAVVAGKNFFGFDMRFLRQIRRNSEGGCKFEDKVKFHHRAHDPAELYFDPKSDELPPGLDQCLARAGIQKSVEHSAVADALDVIRVLRYKWGIEC